LLCDWRFEVSHEKNFIGELLCKWRFEVSHEIYFIGESLSKWRFEVSREKNFIGESLCETPIMVKPLALFLKICPSPKKFSVSLNGNSV
jgi:hypothetical protein